MELCLILSFNLSLQAEEAKKTEEAKPEFMKIQLKKKGNSGQ